MSLDSQYRANRWNGFTLLLFISSFILLPPSSFSQPPAWWITRGAIDTNQTVNDYAPAVAGQLKWMASKAKEELDANLFGGSGTGVAAVVSAFSNSYNLSPVLIGQLKYVAFPFHNRLTNAGYSSSYPWTTTMADDNDFAPALIGQLKFVFDFDVNRDTDGDGLIDYDEINEYLTDPYSWDTDGDGISDYDELFEYISNPLDIDTDLDGIDDGSELFFGLNPTNFPAATGIYSNWVYHSRSHKALATWENVPGHWERFIIVDYNAGTNTAFVVMPPQLGLKANSTTQMFVRFSWTTNGSSWTTTEHSGSFYSNIVVSYTNAFHGLPTLGQVTLPVFRFDWAIPLPASNNYVNAYYAPFVRVLTNGHQSGYFWFLDKIAETGNGYGYNNYLSSPQAVGPQFGGVDYRLDLDKTRFRNGGFELGSTLYHTNEPNWGGFGLDGGMSTSIVHSGSRSFVARDLDGIYQRVVVHPGEEFVLSGWMYSPSSTNSMDTNSLSGDRYALISIEYYDVIDGHKTKTDAARISADHAKDTWLYYSVTSLVPHRAAYAQVSLRTVAPTVNLVPPGHVYFDDISLVISKDTDRDGMPDRWEVLWPSITSTNNPHDAVLDSDSDGLPNIEEYRIVTNPTSNDTDGDGISDRWEYVNGMDPRDGSDAILDSDGDGISNLVEYEHNTNPSSKDSDGDGLDDGTEIYDFLSDPLTTNFPGYSAIYEVPGTATVERLGSWFESDGYLCSDTLRGTVWYQISIPTADVYQIELEAGDCESWKTMVSYELRASLNDSVLGRKSLTTGMNGVGVATFFTPWLTAGVYTVRFEWDNASDSQRLNVRYVRWGTLNGIDSNSDGKKDWVTNRISRLSGLDNAAISSATSPACVEGRDPFVDFMTIEGGINANTGINGRWYADVPLNVSNTISRPFAFQHGGLITTCQLTWSATEILTTTGTMAVRLGDSLKLSAFPSATTSGTHDVIIAGSSNYIGVSAGTCIAHAFNATGTFTVSGTYYPASGPSQSGSFTVAVYSANFDDSPACWHLVPRAWLCPGVPTNATLESGIDLFISEETNSSPRAFNLTAYTPDNHGIVARLGLSGPIMASATARGFRFGADADTGFQTIGACNTGVTMYENPFVFSPVLDDITIQGKIFIGGLFYEGGSITNYWTPEQFNEVGVLNVRYLKETPGALCSEKLLYQGTNLIGRHSRP